MSKRVYTLKRATPRMKYIHMRNMMEFKSNLTEQQERESRRRYNEGMETCQKLCDLMGDEAYKDWWETAPDMGFFAAAKSKLIEVLKAEMDAVMADTTASAIEQSDAIDAWMTATWDTIPEVSLDD